MPWPFPRQIAVNRHTMLTHKLRRQAAPSTIKLIEHDGDAVRVHSHCRLIPLEPIKHDRLAGREGPAISVSILIQVEKRRFPAAQVKMLQAGFLFFLFVESRIVFRFGNQLDRRWQRAEHVRWRRGVVTLHIAASKFKRIERVGESLAVVINNLNAVIEVNYCTF